VTSILAWYAVIVKIMLSEKLLTFTAMEIPDFIAGLLYGFTSVNHLTEIKSCYEDGINIDQFVKTALPDFKIAGTD